MHSSDIAIYRLLFCSENPASSTYFAKMHKVQCLQYSRKIPGYPSFLVLARNDRQVIIQRHQKESAPQLVCRYDDIPGKTEKSEFFTDGPKATQQKYSKSN